MNKKGFTLVELLAVIVILAIILAIAVPTINNLIANSKKSMFENSSKMILRSMKNDYDGKMASTGLFTDTFILYDNGVRTVYPSSNNLDFAISATDGGIVRHSDGTITMALYDGTNCSVKTRTSNDITVMATDKETCLSNIIYKQANAPFANLVTNGDFSQGTTGWGTIGCNISPTNNILTSIGTGAFDTFYPRFFVTTIVNNKYFLKYQHQLIDSISCTALWGTLNEGYFTNPISNYWYALSSIYTATSTSTQIQARVTCVNAAVTNEKISNIKNVIFVDLTTIYGSGNEPTQAQMNHNINKVWIDTTNENTPKKFGGGGWIGF